MHIQLPARIIKGSHTDQIFQFPGEIPKKKKKKTKTSHTHHFRIHFMFLFWEKMQKSLGPLSGNGKHSSFFLFIVKILYTLKKKFSRLSAAKEATVASTFPGLPYLMKREKSWAISRGQWKARPLHPSRLGNQFPPLQRISGPLATWRLPGPVREGRRLGSSRDTRVWGGAEARLTP